MENSEYQGMTDDQIAQYNLSRAQRLPRSEADIKSLSDIIRQTGYQVHIYLGAGYLEKVYENALKHRLEMAGHHVDAQVKLVVKDIDGYVIGNYEADLFVDSKIIVELKAVKALDRAHEAQLMNYLKASKMKVGLLCNFAESSFVYRRLVYN